jgi:hypothetical protein
MVSPSKLTVTFLAYILTGMNRTSGMFKIRLLNNPRLIVITKTLCILSVNRTLILAVLCSIYSLLYITFSCGYRTVCYLEEVSLGMKALSEQTDFSFITAVIVFMKFICVISEVNMETRFVSTKNQ